MNKIIYRAYDPEVEEFIYSDQDYDEAWFEFEDGTLKAFAIHGMSGGDPMTPPEPNVEELEPCQLCLHIPDKNGKILFDGDRVTCLLYDNPEIRESTIKWSEKMAGFTICGYPMNIHGLHDIEIIGHDGQ